MKDVPRPARSPIIARPLDEVRKARGDAKVAVVRSKVASLRAFRRVWPDRVFGIFGVLLVVVATGLIFSWEKKPPVEPKIALAWLEEPHALAEQNHTLTESQPTHVYPFEITDVNVTKVRVNLFWIDDVAEDAVDVDNFSIQIEGPPGTNVSMKEPYVPCCWKTPYNRTFSFRVQDVPEAPSQFSARTVEEAQALLGDRTQRVGTGLWKVTVTLNQANDHYESELARGQPCPANSPSSVCTPDTSNWVAVRFGYSTYHPEFEPI